MVNQLDKDAYFWDNWLHTWRKKMKYIPTLYCTQTSISASLPQPSPLLSPPSPFRKGNFKNNLVYPDILFISF